MQWRRDQLALDHGEQVLPAPLADEAVDVQRHRLVVAVHQRLHLHELGVHVVGRRLGHRRKRVGRDAPPRTDLDRHALGERVVPEILAPRERRHRHLDRRAERVDPQVLVAAVDERTQIARLEIVDRDDVEAHLPDLVARVRQLHAIDACGVHEALDVVVESEDGGAALGVVRADALEHTGAVVHHMGQDVDLRVVPRDPLPIHPDLVHFGERHHAPRRVKGRAWPLTSSGPLPPPG